ncbi:hypothetical protein GGX14DRAFT_472494 [Mycena pura]|uniref:Uncharacterized protein n=1 Tax=Mycena pura TaxID=153505 RepID=A0AAD6Y918_9AGAR|nr:hypothetical protein GGX14DRAFT_472494 [Mycena pura]
MTVIQDCGSPLDSDQCHYSQCVLCGYLPLIPPSCSTMIQEFLKNDASGRYVDFFQTIGLHNDDHLRVFLGMDKEDREQFLQGYVPARLTDFGVNNLIRLLDEFATSRPWAALSVSPVPRKPGADRFEDVLCSLCPTLVAHHMRFSVEEYHILLKHICRCLPLYLDIHRSFAEQSPKQIETLVQEIRDKYPRINCYEDAWPIRVCLKRAFLLMPTPTIEKPSEVACGVQPFPSLSGCSFERPQNQGCVSLPSSLVNSLPCRHQCTSLKRYLSYGGTKNVSPKARLLLSYLNMDEELVPALYFLGLRNDSDFAAIKQTSRQRRLEFIYQNNLQLNPLQLKVLYKILEI